MDGAPSGPGLQDRASPPDLRRRERAPLRTAREPLKHFARHWIEDVPTATGVPPDDGAFCEGRGCYTTARVERGRVRHLARHVTRLHRDAARIGLGEIAMAALHEALCALAAEHGPGASGIVRLQASRDRSGALHLVGTGRPLGPDPRCWRVVVAPGLHQGPTPWSGAKVTSRLRFALAGDAARTAGVEEAILFDAAGRLVEGARTTLVVVDERDVPLTPPLARGGVAGVAREILLERVASLRQQDVDRDALARAREVVVVNAVRGARPVVAIDGRTVGNGRPGPWAARLASVLEAD